MHPDIKSAALVRTHLINALGSATRAKALFIGACNAGLKGPLFHRFALKRIYEMASSYLLVETTISLKNVLPHGSSVSVGTTSNRR